MARTITEIYDALALEKSTMPQLQDLQPDVDTAQQLLQDVTSPSQVARWRLLLWVVAVATWVHEQLWDQFRAEVTALAAASHVGTLRWYVEQARRFQLGYALVDINGVFTYAVDDPGARIVARAAGIEAGGLVLLKVAKESSGALVPLSAPERAAFEAYINEIKFAGTIINVLTADPDQLRVVFNVYYNPLVLAADGSLILDGTIKPVEDAIHTHLASLPFNGALVLTSLVDAVQAAEGVVNPVLVTAEAKYGLFPYAGISVQYVANAGHMIVDPLNPLSTTINYLPSV